MAGDSEEIELLIAQLRAIRARTAAIAEVDYMRQWPDRGWEDVIPDERFL